MKNIMELISNLAYRRYDYFDFFKSVNITFPSVLFDFNRQWAIDEFDIERDKLFWCEYHKVHISPCQKLLPRLRDILNDDDFCFEKYNDMKDVGFPCLYRNYKKSLSKYCFERDVLQAKYMEMLKSEKYYSVSKYLQGNYNNYDFFKRGHALRMVQNIFKEEGFQKIASTEKVFLSYEVALEHGYKLVIDIEKHGINRLPKVWCGEVQFIDSYFNIYLSIYFSEEKLSGYLELDSFFAVSEAPLGVKILTDFDSLKVLEGLCYINIFLIRILIKEINNILRIHL